MKEKFYYLLYPRPCYIIGSGSIKQNTINFMTACWISPISDDPQIVIFSCWKGNYTSELINKYLQFSINVIEDLKLIWSLGTCSGRNINKVEKFNLKVKSGKVLDVPILENALGFLECKVIDIKEVSDYFVYFGEVKNWEAKNHDKFGFKEFWKIPLQKAGRAFTRPSKKLEFP